MAVNQCHVIEERVFYLDTMTWRRYWLNNALKNDAVSIQGRQYS